MFSFESLKQFILLFNFKTSFLFVESKHFFCLFFWSLQNHFSLAQHRFFFFIFWDNTNSFSGNIYVDFVFIKSFKNIFFRFIIVLYFALVSCFFFIVWCLRLHRNMILKRSDQITFVLSPLFCLKFGSLSFHSQHCMHLVLRVYGPLKMLRLNVNALTMWTSFCCLLYSLLGEQVFLVGISRS